MPFASRNGCRLFYRREGRGDPPLVFVHGWCCDHTIFQPQFEYFRRGHDVMALDLRGCGSSDRPESGYGIPALAADVAGLCRELGIDRPVVIGHSLGGMIGIELAARHPDLPGAIVAVDPGPIDPLPASTQLLHDLATALEGPDGDATRREYVASLFLPTDDAGVRRTVVDAMGSVPRATAAVMMREILAWNGVAALQHCRAPLLVLRSKTGGSNDPARLIAHKPDVHIGVTVGAGHFHQLLVPEQVNLMIERFVQVVVGKP